LIPEHVDSHRGRWGRKKRGGASGRWPSNPIQREYNSLGSAFDGSEGVDSEDILGIPQIDFSTFQFFPDQTQYKPDNPNFSPFDNKVQIGMEWIKKQAQTAQQYDTLKSFELCRNS
jgi:mannan endo-1,4-beta-mannosidase